MFLDWSAVRIFVRPGACIVQLWPIMLKLPYSFTGGRVYVRPALRPRKSQTYNHYVFLDKITFSGV
jgi:hypothetical protein